MDKPASRRVRSRRRKSPGIRVGRKRKKNGAEWSNLRGKKAYIRELRKAMIPAVSINGKQDSGETEKKGLRRDSAKRRPEKALSRHYFYRIRAIPPRQRRGVSRSPGARKVEPATQATSNKREAVSSNYLSRPPPDLKVRSKERTRSLLLADEGEITTWRKRGNSSQKHFVSHKKNLEISWPPRSLEKAEGGGLCSLATKRESDVG